MERQMISATEKRPVTPPEIPVKQKRNFWIVFPAVFTGLIVSLLVLPAWLPGMVSSIAATDQRVFWYLSRATAIVAYLVLWLSMVWGLLMTTRLVKNWPGFPPSNNLHKFFATFGLSLGVLHGLLLLGDQFMNFSLKQILIPFANTTYRPTWVGFGQISLYMWGLILLSFYLRKKIGQKTWRILHILTFLTYASVFIHGTTSGSDSGTVLMQVVYWVTGLVFIFLLGFRLLASSATKRQPLTVPVRKD
jgi:predicted ferric reductase